MKVGGVLESVHLSGCVPVATSCLRVCIFSQLAVQQVLQTFKLRFEGMAITLVHC